MPRTIGLLNVFMNILSSSTVWSPHSSMAPLVEACANAGAFRRAVLVFSKMLADGEAQPAIQGAQNGPFWDVQS